MHVRHGVCGEGLDGRAVIMEDALMEIEILGDEVFDMSFKIDTFGWAENFSDGLFCLWSSS